MKPYEQLTWPGKLRRLRRLAQNALAQYDLAVERFELVAYDTNLIYRVRTPNGAQYALRLANDAWRSKDDAESEVLWLDALARDTTIRVPQIIHAKDGSGVVTPLAEGAPTGYHALLMRWLPGTLLGKRLTEPNVVKMGELFGQLHLHAGAWQPPQGFTTRRFDKMIARGEPDRLLSEAAVALYRPETTAMLRRMRAKVEAAYAALDPADLRVIHCDLWHDNIKVQRGLLSPFDFEDTIWGYRIHDIAMAMLDLYEVIDQASYEHLLAAFRRGYETQLPWPQGELELFQIGRILWRINHFACHIEQVGTAWLAKDAAFNTALFQRYLDTGKLIPPLRTPRAVLDLPNA